MNARMHVALAAILLVAFGAGCGMIGLGGAPAVPIVGTWSSMDPGAEVIFTFNPDHTMTCDVPEAPEYSFGGTWSVDASGEITALDLADMVPAGIGASCAAIVRFPSPEKMEFVGNFNGGARPSSFENGSASDFSRLRMRFDRVN